MMRPMSPDPRITIFRAGQKTFNIYQALGGSCCVNSSGAKARNIQSAPGALPAAHGQNHRFCLNLEKSILPVMAATLLSGIIFSTMVCSL